MGFDTDDAISDNWYYQFDLKSDPTVSFFQGFILTVFYFVKDELFNMTRAWDKDKSESPTGIEPMTSRTPGRHSIH